MYDKAKLVAFVSAVEIDALSDYFNLDMNYLSRHELINTHTVLTKIG